MVTDYASYLCRKNRAETLPSCKNYRLAGNYNLERYTEDPEYTEIWLPVEPVTTE